MPTNPNYVYWDSCVFLSIFNKEPNRHNQLRTILQEIRNSQGAFKIYASTITLVEVAFIADEKDRRQLNPSTTVIMDQLLVDSHIVTQVETTSFIMMQARDYVRGAMARGFSLKPADAIHLSTAIFSRSFELHTYNTSDFESIVRELSLDITVTEPKSLSSGPLFNQ